MPIAQDPLDKFEQCIHDLLEDFKYEYPDHPLDLAQALVWQAVSHMCWQLAAQPTDKDFADIRTIITEWLDDSIDTMSVASSKGQLQ